MRRLFHDGWRFLKLKTDTEYETAEKSFGEAKAVDIPRLADL